MIEVQPLTGPEPQRCPQCLATLYTILFEGQELTEDEPPYFDGDIVPVYHTLTPERRDGFGWSTLLAAGRCPVCYQKIFCITAAFMDAEPGDEVENDFMHHNGDRGPAVNFIARRGDERWIVTRLCTPQGPMLEHEFGPFADIYGDWIGPAGVSICQNGGPWDFAREFLLERWDELRTMPKAIGLDLADPRAQVHRVAVSAQAARAARAAERQDGRRPIVFSSPPETDDLDDDIPF